jgi:hypothetical protein
MLAVAEDGSSPQQLLEQFWLGLTENSVYVIREGELKTNEALDYRNLSKIKTTW